MAGTEFGDDELQHLGSLTRVREWHLAATRVPDVGMEHVGRLLNRERLYLAKCDVGDAGLAHVAKLRRLQAISICVQIKGMTPRRFEALPKAVVTSFTSRGKARRRLGLIVAKDAHDDGWWNAHTLGRTVHGDF